MRRKELKAILPESNGCRQYSCELTEWQREERFIVHLSSFIETMNLMCVPMKEMLIK